MHVLWVPSNGSGSCGCVGTTRPPESDPPWWLGVLVAFAAGSRLEAWSGAAGVAPIEPPRNQ